MKYLLTILVSSVLIFIASCDNSGSNLAKANKISEMKSNINSKTIMVYYFHGSIRCETCVAVDNNTQEYLLERFADQIEKGEIIFKSINIDKQESPELIEEYKIYGQTLLFIKGEKVLDKTEDAFQYVTTNPIKWNKIVETSVRTLIGIN